ncbi:hypothetical protein F5B22DRAFT_435793 [Xylaria bambusicola]|uniref:uncharacterized protein n=1 Tax=Xylaria bambusicola TaxID=326684 RepID=UPI0020088612|nr:uncharacterized protein F5B22DRAFT_435793 [Xylaria bambusicola]KAI0506744.1 hypothetical protein F5B22DRAFT_435793 [Xylaria bambusicola]
MIHQDADMFFQRSGQISPPTTTTSICARSITPAIQTVQNPMLAPSSLDKASYHHASVEVALGMHQIPNETSSHVFPKTTQSTFLPPVHQNTFCYTEKAKENDIMDLDNSDYASTATFNSMVTSTVKKGLAESIWNPANRKVRADSVSSSQSLQPPRSTTGEAPIVFSGLTKGPGLQASRWSDGV